MMQPQKCRRQDLALINRTMCVAKDLRTPIRLVRWTDILDVYNLALYLSLTQNYDKKPLVEKPF